MAIFTVHIPAARAGEAPSAEKNRLAARRFFDPRHAVRPFLARLEPRLDRRARMDRAVVAGGLRWRETWRFGANSVAGEHRSRLPARIRRLAADRWTLARRGYNESAIVIG